MPKVTVKSSFTFKEGGQAKLYKKGEVDLSDAALAHAHEHGYVEKPKSEQPKGEKAAAKAAETPK